MPEDVTAERIVSLDNGIIASAHYRAESDIIEELGVSKQTEVEEEENNDDDEVQWCNRSITGKKSP